MRSLTFEKPVLIFPHLWWNINWTNDRLNESKFWINVYLMFIKTNVQED